MDSDDAARRQEINLFSAMALGASDTLTGPPPLPAKDEEPVRSFKENDSVGGSMTSSTSNMTNADNAFLAAFASDSSLSGTFSFASSSEPPQRSEAEKSNLSAAIALLSEPEKTTTTVATSAEASIPPTLADGDANDMVDKNPQRITPEKDLPMFCEKVTMSRPLFYGAILPPRILKEARRMYCDAVETYQKDHPGKEPRLRDLPPNIRNVVGAVKVFGFGKDVVQDDGDECSDTTMDAEDCRGSALLSSYQPCWGHDERVKRVERHMEVRERLLERPSLVSRSFTAPAELSKLERTQPDTEAGQPTHEIHFGAQKEDQNQLFSMWLRQDDDSKMSPAGSFRSGGGSFESVASIQSTGNHSINNNNSMDSVEVKNEATGKESSVKSEDEREPQSEQALFSMWAMGGGGGTFVTSDTFNPKQSMVEMSADSDDESVHEDEMKKQVGISDHLSKAIASFTDDVEGQTAADLSVEPSQILSQQDVQNGSLRPFTNYELSNGCVPIFAADDKPLPESADLGNHETKEEQMRYNELKRSQEVIERFVKPDVFGTVACPNPSHGPDDIHSWNSRTASSRRSGNLPGTPSTMSDAGSLQSNHTRKTINSLESNEFGRSAQHASPGVTSPPRPKEPTGSKGRRRQSRFRQGWFNISKSAKPEPQSPSLKNASNMSDKGMLYVPPPANEISISTLLEPSPDTLRESNLPLSRLHAATPMEQSLAYLSDRPHSFRYLQIDTQAIGFPPLKGEVEPLFCSLAIYNVETVSTTPGGESSPAPVPDLQRCGRVTEALYFDVVGDQTVAQRCSEVLWPYSSSHFNDSFESTRCGVFPLPSNLNVANLYAVLIVRKVLAEESDSEPYLKPGKNVLDIERLRSNAEKASNRHGQLLMPLAFGVAPLLQVFGSDNPFFATSRAVQIPLFRFKGEERQIIDHIMVMLYPRANHKASGVGGPAAVTNGGNAMLVMRNFGYLGLHVAVDKKSSLARDRLVDFTGELQIRRMEASVEDEKMELGTDYSVRTPAWHKDIITEATENGGRNRIMIGNRPGVDEQSRHYAQELAPLPLQLSPPARLSTRKGRLHGQDIEPFYHTSFCNELLFHPRILHNCKRRVVTLKVELREIEWKESLNGYFAHMPQCGSTIHNNRRGPFLVPSSFTTCAVRKPSQEHHFIDEFKIKLPLDLKPRRNDGSSRFLSLFFTVFSARMGSKNKWKRAKGLFTAATGDGAGDMGMLDGNGKSRLDQVACGFLPISSPNSLIDNGLHDVRIVYKARHPPRELLEQWNVPETSLALVERKDGGDSHHNGGKEDTDDTTVSYESNSDRYQGNEFMRADRSLTSDLGSAADDSKANKNHAADEPVSLSVRIVAHSSLHSQNEALNEFLGEEPDLPETPVLSRDSKFMSNIKINRLSLSKKATEAVHSGEDPLEEHLLHSTLSVTDNLLCTVPRSSPYLLRTLPILWRQLVFGQGDPNLAWSNPSSMIPLRLHSFASILHLLGGACLYLSKNGVTEADGMRKWNMVVLGRVIAMLFDEEKLFGTQAKEVFDLDNWSLILDAGPQSSGSAPKRKSPKVGRHSRATMEFSRPVKPEESKKDLRDTEFLSSVAGALAGPTRNSVKRHPLDTKGKGGSLGHLPEAGNIFDPKVDSKTDFQTALRASLAPDADVDFDMVQNTSSAAPSSNSKSMMQALSSLSGGGNRRFMTMPAQRTLTTIRESEDDDEPTDAGKTREIEDLLRPLQSPLETPSVLKKQSRGVRQMRIPTKKQFDDVELPIPETKTPGVVPIVTPLSETPEGDKTILAHSGGTLPPTDDDLENVTLGFLDAIGESLGMSTSKGSSGEESRVGSKNHRRMRSRSSIDWTVMGLESTSVTSTPTSEAVPNVDSPDDTDERMTTLMKEDEASIAVPNFVDRLVALGKAGETPGRWFPYTYEVVICQWAAVLVEQRRLGTNGGPVTEKNQSSPGRKHADMLPQAALRSIGVAVAGAPMLLEVIKQSIGFRIHLIFEEILTKHNDRKTPPLIILDETLMAALEQVIILVTDACLDPRNFDEWSLRETSVDVNDAVVLFLRDMFSFLAPNCVYRLIMAYYSRFLEKENSGIQDRDSKIGLRCSWEATKLRLNAVTSLIRFVDMTKVNSPQMINWRAWWVTSLPVQSDEFFNNYLSCVKEFRTENKLKQTTSSSQPTDFGSLHHHWLVELVVDVCLQGTEHVEAYIQQRSASLLHELFWNCSQEGQSNGTSAPIATMLFTYLEKLLPHTNYLASFAPKSQMRKDLLPNAIYVLQNAAPGLLRAYFRSLCLLLQGRGESDCYRLSPRTRCVGFESDSLEAVLEEDQGASSQDESNPNSNVVDMFTLLNLCLRTMEFEGAEENADLDNIGQTRDSITTWRRDYLLASEQKLRKDRSTTEEDQEGTSSISRRWQSHDGALVVVNTVHQIVLEMYGLLRKSPKGMSYLNPAVNRRSAQARAMADAGECSSQNGSSDFTYSDVLVFVRASTSVYLHALSLQESDLVVIRTLSLSAEVIKIFGISTFLDAIGETLQHWTRVILLLCGARRASVRIESTDLLELILRTTWECFGSFFRIRVPLLAVQTEVMQRIFATATSRYYREQRRLGVPIEPLSTVSAEASLAPLWRTLDRIETQPASQNIAFRGALVRMAGKLKILYRAYIATRVLSLLGRNQEEEKSHDRDFNTESKLRAARISIMRVVNASGGHSKQFLGFQGTRQDNARVAHFEAVEDALIEAADVFSPTELPEHRFSWLRMLAELHASRKKFAEQATCHFQIHVTLSQAAMLHGSLWSNTPFLPWTDSLSDPTYAGGDPPTGDPDYPSLEYEESDAQFSQIQGNASSRRIFYRVANSVGDGASNAYWDASAVKTLFAGVAFPSEYQSVRSWLTLREMEENMVEEAELAGDLYLKAGIVVNSRLAWNLATQYYASRFNYAKLRSTYENLSSAIVSKVPTIDPDVAQEVSTVLGRFYRVWFHGGAPDELTGIEFVYRTEGSVSLSAFGRELKRTVKSIIQDNTPIHLLLDGRMEERIEEGSSNFGNFSRIGPAPLAPVKVKVTPLRPLFAKRPVSRGLPEWFYQYVDEAFSSPSHLMRGETSLRRPELVATVRSGPEDPHHREHSRSFSVGVFGGAGDAAGKPRRGGSASGMSSTLSFENERHPIGVDRFCFLQPRDRNKASKDWWKNSGGKFAEKSVKVTQLQVGQPFPACVARQPVVHRLVYSISPLEASVDAVSQWCALLFRTAVATTGMNVLGTSVDPGIGVDAAKVVADSIHSSHVKDIGLELLKKNRDLEEEEDDAEFSFSPKFDSLSEDETRKLQAKLARLIVVFLELLHILVARNRDVLLEIIHERKNRDPDRRFTARDKRSGSFGGNTPMPPQPPPSEHKRVPSAPSVTTREHTRSTSGATSVVGHRRHTGVGEKIRPLDDGRPKIRHGRGVSDDTQTGQTSFSTSVMKTDSAIAVQSELQRAFMNLTKTLHPHIQGVLQSDTPRWLRQCSQENYFSMGNYRNTKIRIAEELCISSGDNGGLRHVETHNQFEPNYESPRNSVGGGSVHSVMSRGSERYGLNST